MTATIEQLRPMPRIAVAPAPHPLIGADALAVGADLVARPAGTVHVVDDSWHATCGAGRVRFTFPGQPAGDGQVCPRCTAAAGSTSRRDRTGRARKSA